AEDSTANPDPRDQQTTVRCRSSRLIHRHPATLHPGKWRADAVTENPPQGSASALPAADRFNVRRLIVRGAPRPAPPAGVTPAPSEGSGRGNASRSRASRGKILRRLFPKKLPQAREARRIFSLCKYRVQGSPLPRVRGEQPRSSIGLLRAVLRREEHVNRCELLHEVRALALGRDDFD